MSRRAERNLDQIAAWIARDHPQRAVSYILELRSLCHGLLYFPQRFALVTGRPDTHKRSHGNHLITYRVRRDAVTVLSIRHAARDERGGP